MDRVPPFDKIGVTPVPDWQNAAPSAGLPGSIFNVEAINALQHEVVNLISGANLAPDAGNYSQVLAAVRALVAAAVPDIPTYGATEGVKDVNGVFSLDFPDLAELDAIVAAALFAYFDPGSGQHKRTTAAALASFVISTIAASTTVNILPNVVSVTGQYNVFTRALLANLYNVSEGVVTATCSDSGYVDFTLPYSYPDEKFTVLCQDTNGAGSTSGGPGIMITGVPLNGGTVRIYPRVPSTGAAYVGNLTFKYIAAGHSSI